MLIMVKLTTGGNPVDDFGFKKRLNFLMLHHFISDSIQQFNLNGSNFGLG